MLFRSRYGTIPIVHPTGGLADTIVDVGAGSLAARRATGFHVSAPDTQAVIEAIERAVTLRRATLTWRRLCETAMAQDFSWGRSAERYLDLYLAMSGAADLAGEEAATRKAALGS